MLYSNFQHHLEARELQYVEKAVFTFDSAVRDVKSGQPILRVVQKLLSQLTEDECLSLLDGDVKFWEGLRTILCDRYNRAPFVHGEIPRLGIPGIRFTDGPRGVVMGSSTAFPVSMARGATWDLSLEERVGRAIGTEARAQGANYFAGVCVNLPRHPAWGRIQETYSENPLLLGSFGLALTKGVQQHVMACVKHFAANSMENARFRVDVNIDEDVLHEVYLPHFRVIVEGGAASVMSSYNSVNGEWAGQSKLLLTDILRHEWNFNGFVISDFIFGLRDAVLSVKNGLDIEAPFKQQRDITLRNSLTAGNLDWSDILKSCFRVLHKQIEYEAKRKIEPPNLSEVFCDTHRMLAREVAARSMVLLKNENVENIKILPLNLAKNSKVAVIGRLANVPNTGDRGSSAVFSPDVVTPFTGIQAALPHIETVLEDSDSAEVAAKIASSVDTVICVVGYDAADEGEYVVPSLHHDPCLLDLLPPAKTAREKEMLALIQGQNQRSENAESESALQVGAGGDRRSLRLRPQDVNIINAVTAANKRVIVVVVCAGAVIMEEWKERVPAIMMGWYSGCEGGHALADVLLGRVDASGRLPFSIPTDESCLPFFDIEASSVKYDRWYGQHLLDKLGVTAAYPLGFGLSYTEFETSDLNISLSTTPETLQITFKVRNTGPRAGRHNVQIYGSPRWSDWPEKVLIGFGVIDLQVGESSILKINASTRPMQRWLNGKFVLPVGTVGIEAAQYAGDPEALQVEFTL